MTLLADVSCGASVGRSVPSKREGADCPNLDSQLFQLSSSTDPTRFAASSDLELADSRVRVIVDLRPGGTLAVSPAIVVNARYADQLDAWVGVDQLCAVAGDAAVVHVSPARRGVPGTAKP